MFPLTDSRDAQPDPWVDLDLLLIELRQREPQANQGLHVTPSVLRRLDCPRDAEHGA